MRSSKSTSSTSLLSSSLRLPLVLAASISMTPMMTWASAGFFSMFEPAGLGAAPRNMSAWVASPITKLENVIGGAPPSGLFGLFCGDTACEPPRHHRRKLAEEVRGFIRGAAEAVDRAESPGRGRCESFDSLGRHSYHPAPHLGPSGLFMPLPSQVAAGTLELIGNSPVVELACISDPSSAQIFGKLESFNPGGSVKDRICLAMIESAEQDGRLLPGGTIVEPTSGNTGIGLAMVAAARGYRLILTMPDTM